MNFDAWEVWLRPSEDYLMHWGIRGMKHGRRRYQNEDGTWTEVGLEERRKREGFGESKKAKKLQKKVERAERKQTRKEAKAERKFQRSEEKRKRSLKGLTDEEMKAKLERAKMEAEYRDITKRGSLVQAGMNLVNKYLEYKDKQEQRTIDFNRQKIEMERIKAQKYQAKKSAEESYYQKTISRRDAKKAKYEAKKAAEDRKGGLKYKRKADLVDAKTKYTAEKRGAIRTWLKNKANKEKTQLEREHELKKMDKTLIEQREKRANAEAVARANAEQARYKVDQERYKASQENWKSHQSQAEKEWRETQARTEYEKERKKKKT